MEANGLGPVRIVERWESVRLHLRLRGDGRGTVLGSLVLVLGLRNHALLGRKGRLGVRTSDEGKDVRNISLRNEVVVKRRKRLGRGLSGLSRVLDL